MHLGAILLVLLSGLVVKVTVMILAARLALKLYRATYSDPPRTDWIHLPREHVREIGIVWWSLVLFCISELSCGIEAYVIFRTSPILSAIHSSASGVGTGLLALAVYMYIDKKALRFAEPDCRAARACRDCTIGQEEGCKFLVVLVLIAAFVALAATPALFTSTEPLVADLDRYTLPFDSLNTWYDSVVVPHLEAYFPNYGRTDEYELAESSLIMEFRILPSAAMILALAAIILLKKRRESLGLRSTAFALGVLSFSYMEVILYPATGTVLIGSLGHELVELWVLLITTAFLRRAFPPEREGRASPSGSGTLIQGH